MIGELTKPKKNAAMKTEERERRGRLFHAVNWVAKATSTDETRHVLTTFLFIAENKDIVATDGQRLHLARVDHSFEPGFYRVLKTGPTVWIDRQAETSEMVTYPNYGQAIPEISPDAHAISPTGNQSYLFNLCVGVHGAGGGVVVNSDYLSDAVPNAARKYVVHISGTDAVSVVRIDHALGTAVVMPMRTN